MLLSMSQKEISRIDVIRDVSDRRLRQKEAARLLSLTRRHIQRLVNAYRAEGPAGLVSIRRGKPSNRRHSSDFKQKVIETVRRFYADFVPSFANEKLRECHQIKVSTEILRQWMMAEGLWLSRRQAKPKVYQPRYRRECLGELIQIDGSHHDWFQGRADKCGLLVYIDDATGRLMTLRFSEVESTYDYMNATREYVEQHGKPVAFYSDKHSVFRLNREEIRGGKKMTQFGRALFELNIELICANSSQAKGRVERANKTLQDRLIKEMRLAGINAIEEANAWLPSFIEDFNHRFARAPYSLQDVHRPLREFPEELDDIFSRQCTRTLTRALTLQYDNVVYILDPNDHTQRLIGKPVMIYDYPDGNIDIKHCGQSLPYCVFDKLRTVTQASITDNKRLGVVLKLAKESQELRGHTTARAKTHRNLSRKAQHRALNVTLLKK